MKKTLMAAAITACLWGGAALADDFSSTSTTNNPSNSDTRSTDVQSTQQLDDQSYGGSGQDTTLAPPETNVNVDINQPAPSAAVQPTTQQDFNKNKESKADMRGLALTVGGGVEGYTGALAPRIAPGPAWDVSAAIKPSKVLGLELGYTGAVNEMRHDVSDTNGADLVRNGGQAVATIGLTAAPVQPYILGGVGVDRYNVRAASTAMRDDTAGRIPLGGGLRTHVGDFTADARMNYNLLFDNDFGGRLGEQTVGLQNSGAGSYTGTLNLGGTF